MRHTRGAVAEIDADGLIRRQKMTTWGILGLALFVSVGMAEWSKRTAAGEAVIDPAVMQEAVKIAAAAAGSVNVKVNVNENLGGELPNSESGKRPYFAARPLRGAATEGVADREANIQTSAGE